MWYMIVFIVMAQEPFINEVVYTADIKVYLDYIKVII